MVVDRDRDRAETLAEQFGIARVAGDFREAIDSADAAIVALPHNLHAPVSSALLSAGLHVLVEKPMALTVAECEEMLEAVRQRGVVLAVGHMRRFLHNAAFAKAAIEAGLLGRLLDFDFREGNVYNWAVSSDFLFRPETAGGGVLRDTGAHTLDLLIWWLGDVFVSAYEDDSFGGVEANCKMRLETAGSVSGSVELSRTRDLRNTAILRGDLGRLEVDLRKNRAVLTLDGQQGETCLAGHGRVGGLAEEPDQGFIDLFVPQLANFVAAIRGHAELRCPADEAAKSVALIEACYAQKEPLAVPWLSTRPETALPDLKGKRVLVTGGTGFIGGRLVERLMLDHGAEVRVLVRIPGHASRVARLTVEMVAGDVLDSEAVMTAAEGCDYIFHCAYDFASGSDHRQKISVQGTENVCRAALRQGVKRMVHVSTFSVYGNVAGDLDETSPKHPTDDAYAQAKLAAEEIVMEFHKDKGLPAVILQPTIVYGPFSRPWTINPLRQLSTGLVPLPNEGRGCCNAVYIDDVVDALCLAATRDDAVGQTFLVSGEAPITWKEFYSAFEEILGRSATVAMSAEEMAKLLGGSGPTARKRSGLKEDLLALVRDSYIRGRIANMPAIQNSAGRLRERFPKTYNYGVTKVFGSRATPVMKSPSTVDKKEKENEKVHVPDRTRVEMLSSETRVKIDKAKRLLGYSPAYDFTGGMAITGEFVRWANLVAIYGE